MSVDPSSRGWNEHTHRAAPIHGTDFNGNAQNATLWFVTGVPPAANGLDGDFAFRKDGTAGAAIYQRRAGVWVAIA